MIRDEEIIRKVTEIVTPILRDEQIDLVDIEFHPTGKRWILRLFIDKEGGVRLEDCEHASREIDRSLDVEDVIDHPYVLEVSSPGLTRVLKRKEDFARSIGKRCRIITTSLIEGRTEFRGELVASTEEEIQVKDELHMHSIPMCAIKKANLEFQM
jgi:ribosome maturation factor RimP